MLPGFLQGRVVALKSSVEIPLIGKSLATLQVFRGKLRGALDGSIGICTWKTRFRFAHACSPEPLLLRDVSSPKMIASSASTSSSYHGIVSMMRHLKWHGTLHSPSQQGRQHCFGWLWGPSGSGRTFTATGAANSAGVHIVRISSLHCSNYNSSPQSFLMQCWKQALRVDPQPSVIVWDDIELFHRSLEGGDSSGGPDGEKGYDSGDDSEHDDDEARQDELANDRMLLRKALLDCLLLAQHGKIALIIISVSPPPLWISHLCSWQVWKQPPLPINPVLHQQAPNNSPIPIPIGDGGGGGVYDHLHALLQFRSHKALPDRWKPAGIVIVADSTADVIPSLTNALSRLNWQFLRCDGYSLISSRVGGGEERLLSLFKEAASFPSAVIGLTGLGMLSSENNLTETLSRCLDQLDPSKFVIAIVCQGEYNTASQQYLPPILRSASRLPLTWHWSVPNAEDRASIVQNVWPMDIYPLSPTLIKDITLRSLGKSALVIQHACARAWLQHLREPGRALEVQDFFPLFDPVLS